MKLQSPRERYRQELRAAILDAAREAFVRDGYESVSMRVLAARVGCSHANLYLHFESKEELFDAVVEESFSRFSLGLNRLVGARSAGDPVALLRKAARAYVEFGLEHPGAYEFAFVLRRPGARGTAKPHAGYETARGLVERCIAEKRFRAVDPDEATQALWAALHGITSLLVCRPAFPWADKEAVIRRVIDGAIEGLLRKRGPGE
jgi:AcrR family transcriptional regulator